jgi:hypothetical protein
MRDTYTYAEDRNFGACRGMPRAHQRREVVEVIELPDAVQHVSQAPQRIIRAFTEKDVSLLSELLHARNELLCKLADTRLDDLHVLIGNWT